MPMKPPTVTRLAAYQGGGAVPRPAGLGRDLSATELERIVASGPAAGAAIDSPEAREWLSTLVIQYITPELHHSVWGQFVADRIDAGVRVPEFLPAWHVEQFHRFLDAAASEGLHENEGWRWTVCDDAEVLWSEDFSEGFDPLSAEGAAGFVFRSASDRVQIA